MKKVLSENITQKIINKQILNQRSSLTPPVPAFSFPPAPPTPPFPAPAPKSVISSFQQIQLGNFINHWLSMVQKGQTSSVQIGAKKSHTRSKQDLEQEQEEIKIIYGLEHRQENRQEHSQEHRQEYKNIVDTLIIKPKNFIFIILSVIVIILVLLLPHMFLIPTSITGAKVNNTNMVF